MTGKMPTLTGGRSLDEDIELIELSPHSRLPRLDFGVDWESPWREFRTSVRDFFTGPRAPKGSENARNSVFHVEWVRGKLSGWAFTASSLWHVAVVVLLILPIWGFLPATQHNLAPVRIELTYLPTRGSAAHLVARSPFETEPARRSRKAAAATRRRCLPPSPNNTFNACKRDASAPNPDPAQCAGCRSKNRYADAKYGRNGLRPRLQNLRFNSPLPLLRPAFGSDLPTMLPHQILRTTRKIRGPLTSLQPRS